LDHCRPSVRKRAPDEIRSEFGEARPLEEPPSPPVGSASTLSGARGEALNTPSTRVAYFPRPREVPQPRPRPRARCERARRSRTGPICAPVRAMGGPVRRNLGPHREPDVVSTLVGRVLRHPRGPRVGCENPTSANVEPPRAPTRSHGGLAVPQRGRGPGSVAATENRWDPMAL
jgi:hypothetical protein